MNLDPEDEETVFEATEDGIYLEDIEEDTEITFLVPHSDASTLNAMVRELAMALMSCLTGVSES